MKIYKFILLIFLVNTFASCNDFLDEVPSKSNNIVPSEMEHLEALLNTYNSFYKEPSSELIMGTDDFGFDMPLFDASPSTYSAEDVMYGAWDKDLLPNLSGRIFWSVEWKKIFIANAILNGIDDVTGGTEDERAQMVAECHFIRAYSNFLMATVFCLPYTDANKGELGLPIKQITSFEEDLTRATLEETYAFIEADLMKAMELTRSFGEVNGYNNSWRASTAAVNGFAARYYLSLNNYEMAQSYAQDALDEYSDLRNYNTGMRYSLIPAFATIYNPDPTQVEIFYPYTHDQQSIVDDRLDFGEAYYFRELDNSGWKYWPSRELLGLYDEAYDLRFKYHIVEDYSYTRNADGSSGIDPYSYPGYIFYFKSGVPTGPSVPEMLLTKAECQVRQGSYAQGLQTVNVLRAARFDASAPVDARDLSAASQEEALVKVLEERRREMPFAHRWMDLKRYNNNENTADDVTVSRTFYPYNPSTILGLESPQTYTLEKNSRRYAYPLPTTDIIASGGQLVQNTY